MNIFIESLKRLLLIGVIVVSNTAEAQTESVIAPSNRSAVGLEKNLLFYADQRYSVSQSGTGQINLTDIFDGNQYATYSNAGIDLSDPYVLLIENLPNKHVQVGGWIGWTARHYQPKRFKIEIYNIYQGANSWITMSDVSGYAGGHYIAKTPSVTVGKIRITIYETTDSQNRLGLSEVFFLHPEAVKAYDGLTVQYTANGDVGIGTTSPKAKLAVEGNILAKEIKVTNNIAVPDYVFEPNYKLTSLSEIETYVKEYKHLPEIPSAKDIEQNGLDLGEMNLLLLKKVEELTLHLIEKEKRIRRIEKELTEIKKRN